MALSNINRYKLILLLVFLIFISPIFFLNLTQPVSAAQQPLSDLLRIQTETEALKAAEQKRGQAHLEKEKKRQARAAELARLKQEKEKKLQAQKQEQARLKAEQEERLRLKQEAEAKKREEARLQKERERQERAESLRLKKEAEAKRPEQVRLEEEKERQAREAELARLRAERAERLRLKQEAEARRREEVRLEEEKERQARAAELARLKQEKEEKLHQLRLRDEAQGLALKETEERLVAQKTKEEVIVTEETEARVSSFPEESEKKPVPPKVDLDFSDVPLNQILATIARLTDLNIAGGEALSQKISAHLKEVPLKDAFDIILKSTDYTYFQDGKVLRIVPKTEAPLITEVFELRFVSAQKVKEAMSNLVSEKGSVKIFPKLSQDIYSNLLIVRDTPESLKVIRDLIKKLDKRIRQVMIEAKFCEVTLSKDDEYGVDWVLKATLTGARGPTTFPWKSTGDKFMGLSKVPFPYLTSSTPGTTGTISFSEFTTTLKLLDSESTINLIASPQVATREGEEASIVIGKKVPIPTYERNKDTGAMEITGYATQDVGILLRVTPVINIDSTVTVKIHPEYSEITGYTGPNNERPIVSTRQIDTVFTIGDGKTIVLGGLMNQNLSDTVRRVPVLGNIPVLGSLFRFKDKSSEKKELLIFITPRILDEAEPLKKKTALKNKEAGNEPRK